MRTILITGATGGLGQALCRCFAKDACRIAVHTYRNQTQGERLLETLCGDHCEMALFSADLKDPAAVQKMFRELEDQWGGIDLLVNNAGIRNDRLLQSIKVPDWDELIAENLLGCPSTCEEVAQFIRHLSKMKHVSGQTFNLDSRIA